MSCRVLSCLVSVSSADLLENVSAGDASSDLAQDLLVAAEEFFVAEHAVPTVSAHVDAEICLDV